MRRYAKNLFCVISRNIIKVNWPFLIRSRGNRLGVFLKIRVFENFAKLTRKHLCQSLFFNKVKGLKPVMLLKRRLCLSYCSVSFDKLLSTFSSLEHHRWLRLKVYLPEHFEKFDQFLLRNTFRCIWNIQDTFRYTSYFISNAFFNSALVLLTFFMNWGSYIAQVLLNTYKHDHTETLFIYTFSVSM